MRYRIGEFSRMGKVSVKTLRYYDEVGLLRPGYVDGFNRYRYYLPEQLTDLRTIVSYRDAGLSVEDILEIRSGADIRPILERRRSVIESEMERALGSIRRIDCLMEGIGMDYSAETREIPGGIVAYRRGRIDRYSDMTSFVFGFRDMCLALNPGLECTEDDYCFVTYRDMEYRESDIELEYTQKVKASGVSGGEIGFREIRPVLAVCVKHVGPYDRLGDAYAFILRWMDENGMELVEAPRECYIDGCWNRDSEDEYLTEIQFPIRYI